jgi:hypothetical protein
MLTSVPPDLTVSLEDGWVSPSYGVRHSTSVVVFRTSAMLPLTLAYSFLVTPDHP